MLRHFLQRPGHHLKSDSEPPHLAKAMKELRSPGKIVNREKFEAAKMLTMHGNNSKKRRRNDEGERDLAWGNRPSCLNGVSACNLAFPATKLSETV